MGLKVEAWLRPGYSPRSFDGSPCVTGSMTWRILHEISDAHGSSWHWYTATLLSKVTGPEVAHLIRCAVLRPCHACKDKTFHEPAVRVSRKWDRT